MCADLTPPDQLAQVLPMHPTPPSDFPESLQAIEHRYIWYRTKILCLHIWLHQAKTAKYTGLLLPCPLDSCYFERFMNGRDSCWQPCQLQQDIKPSVRSTCMSCRMGPAHLLWMCKHPFWCCMTLMPRPSLCQMWLLQQRARPGSSFQSASQHGRCSCPTAPGTQCLRSQVYCSASAGMSAILRVLGDCVEWRRCTYMKKVWS